MEDYRVWLASTLKIRYNRTRVLPVRQQAYIHRSEKLPARDGCLPLYLVCKGPPTC